MGVALETDVADVLKEMQRGRPKLLNTSLGTLRSRDSNMTDQIPPLPKLEIDGRTKQFTDQETMDRMLQLMYERRPDLFKRMAAREGNPAAGPNDEFTDDFYRFVREELKITSSLMQPRIFWEARRRARLMYGMSI